MSGTKWTKEEVEILQKNFGLLPVRLWCNELPRRSLDAIHKKAQRVGLMSSLSGVYSPPPKYQPELPKFEDQSFEELWEAAYVFQVLAKQLSTRQEEVNVHLDVDYPIALTVLADAHIGAISTPLDQLKERFEMIAEQQGFYCLSAGDTHDNFLPSKHPQGTFGTMFPPELQKELVLNLYSKLKGRWIAAVQGCHDEFSHYADDFDFTKYLTHQLKCANLGFGGLINLYVGDQLYVIAIRHKYRFNSSYNPTHSPKQLKRFEYPEADILIVAHNHRAAIEQLSHRDKDRVYIRPGSFKGVDRYARSIGFNDTGSQMPTVILFPDRREMLPFLHLERAIASYRGLSVA